MDMYMEEWYTEVYNRYRKKPEVIIEPIRNDVSTLECLCVFLIFHIKHFLMAYQIHSHYIHKEQVLLTFYSSLFDVMGTLTVFSMSGTKYCIAISRIRYLYLLS